VRSRQAAPLRPAQPTTRYCTVARSRATARGSKIHPSMGKARIAVHAQMRCGLPLLSDQPCSKMVTLIVLYVKRCSPHITHFCCAMHCRVRQKPKRKIWSLTAHMAIFRDRQCGRARRVQHDGF
jgi:hypothetical protein